MGQRLDPVDQSGARSYEGGVGIDRPHGHTSGYDSTLDHLRGQLASPVESVATRRDHDHIGLRRFNSGPLDLLRSLTGGTKHGFRTGRRDHVGYPVAGGKRGVGPLEHRETRRGPPATAAAIRWSRPCNVRTRAAAGSGVSVARPTVPIDARTSVKVIGSSVTTAARHPK